MADITKIKHGSSVYNIKDADAARQEQADWNTNNGVKNMLDCIKDGYLYPYSGGGITVTVDETNGTATINGTATRQISFYVQRGSLDTSKRFKLTGCPTGGDYASGYSLYVAAGTTTYAFDEGNGTEFVPQTNHTDIRVLIRSGATLDNVVFKPMLRPAFIKDDTFEPYAKSNAELTAIISDLQARVLALENQ